MNKLRNLWHRVAAFALVAFTAMLALPASAEYSIVTADSNGNVTFDPSGIVAPIITAVVAAVGSAAALFLIAVGVRWLYRMIKGSK